MTTHTDTELLSAYLDGEVPGAERAGIEQHLASCAECSARKTALEGVIRSVHNLPPVMANEAEHAALRRAVLGGAGAGAQVRALGRGRAWRVLGATAAVAAALAGILTFALVNVHGPKVSDTASAPARAPASPAPANLSSDADVRSYAASLGAVSTFLGQIHASAGAQAPDAIRAPAHAAAPSPEPRLGTAPVPSGAAAAPRAPGTFNQAGPPTLGSCTRAAVPPGGALIQAAPVVYQGAPAWAIAYGTSSATSGVLDRVVVEIRSQAACALLDQAILTP